MHGPVSLSVLSCYIVQIRDAVYHFHSCEIYWFKLFTYCTSYLCFLLSVLHLIWLLVILRKNGWNKSTVQIRESTHFLHFRRRYYFRSGDHLRYNLGIICGPIWGSFAGLYSPHMYALQLGAHEVLSHKIFCDYLPKCVRVKGFEAWTHYCRDKEVNNAYFYSSTEIFESVASNRGEFVCDKAG